MDPVNLGLIITLVLLILLSSYFSATETAFSTVNKVRLRTLESDGNKSAGAVLKLLDKYDRLLSTVLIGNNIVNITSATIATVLFTRLIVGHEDLAAVLSTLIMTIIVLIFGEITPKTIAKQHAEWFSMKTWRLLKVFTIILFPLDIMLVPVKMLIQKIFKNKSASSITEDELITYVETAHSEGGIDEHESRLIRSAIEFDDLDVDDIMIPRVSVVAIEENEDLEIVGSLFYEHGFSRLPVFSKTVDSIIGIIHEKDYYHLMNIPKGTRPTTVKSIIQSGICVSPSMKISTVLRMLQKAKIHMAVVVDEFGGTAGIVTLEDILEELVGEIWDEHDHIEVLVKKIGEDTYLVGGTLNLEEMFDELNIDVKEEFDSTTVGGWVTEELGKIPVAGEGFSYRHLDISVSKANAKMVMEIKVKVNAEEDDE